MTLHEWRPVVGMCFSLLQINDIWNLKWCLMFSSHREISLSLPPTHLLKPNALIIMVWQVDWKGLKKKIKIETQSTSSIFPAEMGF